MRKFLMLLVLAATLFACDSDDDEVFIPEISTNVQKLHYTNEGGTRTITIKSNTDWTLETEADWLTFSEKGGNGNREIRLIAASSTMDERTAVIILKAAGAEVVKIDVTQNSRAVDPLELFFTQEGGVQSFEISVNAAWSVSSDADWLTFSEKEGTGIGTIEVRALANETGKVRTANILVKCSGVNDIVIAVEQRALPETIGLYILSEGTWNANQAELAYYDVKTGTLTKKYFAAQNGGAKLGDTGNDLAIYGSKMYCVVSGASVEAGGGYIEVINPATGKSQKRIEFKGADGKPDLPRKIIFYNGKGYITGHSGVVARLDTTSLVLDAKDKENIRSGMYANVLIPNKTGEDLTSKIMLDKNSIVYRDQLTGVYVIDDQNQANLRWIRLGKSIGNQIEVLSGLTQNDRIVSKAEGKLYNGVKVSVNK